MAQFAIKYLSKITLLPGVLKFETQISTLLNSGQYLLIGLVLVHFLNGSIILKSVIQILAVQDGSDVIVDKRP